MSTSIATLAEQSAAKLFLRLIGAPTTSPNLISAVVAWMRVTSGWSARTEAARILSLSKVQAGSTSGYSQDVAQRLRQEYSLILAAARNGLGGDFLLALIYTGSYGVETNKNPILVAYAKITGLAQPQPKQTQGPPVREPVRPKYLQPPAHAHRSLTAFDTQAFYGARHDGGAIPGLVTD